MAKSKTGFTCTTVGQVKDGTFGLTGLDGVFRSLPGELSDACGQGGTLTGARIVAGDDLKDVRSIIYGVAPGLTKATLTTATGNRALHVADGTFVAALRGYPEDHTAGVTLSFGTRTEHHNFGADGTIPDPAAPRRGRSSATRSAPASSARTSARPAAAPASGSPATGRAIPSARRPASRCGPPTAPGSPTPASCARARRARRASTAGTGSRRPPAPSSGASPAPARRSSAVMLKGAGEPRELTVTSEGAFAAVLPATSTRSQLSLDVTLADGTVEHGRPGEGIAPDLVKSRRPR